MANISIPKILLFDITVEQDYIGQKVQAETILKDMHIDFKNADYDTAELTFCVWFHIRQTVEDDFYMETYIEQKFSLTPIDEILPIDLHRCVTTCSEKLQEMIKVLYDEFDQVPIVIPMRYDEGFFRELVEKIKFQAFGERFGFGSFN